MLVAQATNPNHIVLFETPPPFEEQSGLGAVAFTKSGKVVQYPSKSKILQKIAAPSQSKEDGGTSHGCATIKYERLIKAIVAMYFMILFCKH